LREISTNPLADYVARQPQLRAVAFNGLTAAKLGRRVLAASEVTLIDLPSSSPPTRWHLPTRRALVGACEFRSSSHIGVMANETKIASLGAAADAEAEAGPLSMVDEALVAGNIANTNGLLVIVAKLVAKGIFDEEDLQAFSDSYSKPLDHEHMRANELVSQMQDQMEETLAQLMRFLAERP
jgi:hypothetical protein